MLFKSGLTKLEGKMARCRHILATTANQCSKKGMGAIWENGPQQTKTRALLNTTSYRPLSQSAPMELLLLLTLMRGKHRPQCYPEAHSGKHNSCAQRASRAAGTEARGGVD